MSGTRNSRINGWHIAALFASLMLVFGIGMTASGAFAGRLADQNHPSVYYPSTPYNLVTNGNFETGSMPPFTTTVNSGSGAINSDPPFVHAGTYSALINSNINNNSSAGVGGGGSCSGGVRIPVSSNTSYTWTGFIFVPVTATNFLNTRVRVAWYASPNCSGGSQLSTVDSNILTSATGTWVQVTGTAISPPTAAFAEIRLLASAGTGGVATSVYFDDIVFDVTPGNTPTPVPTCGTGSDYVFSNSTGSIDSGGVLVPGSQCLDCVVTVTLPFSYSLYGQPYGAVNASSNGNLQFSSTSTAFANACLPSGLLNNAILPFWDGLDSSPAITTSFTTGLYTSTTGSAPNRRFNIEWRACRYDFGGCNNGSANFEVRLYEGQEKFDFVYGNLFNNGNAATIGVQRGIGGTFTQYSCNTGSVSTGTQITFRTYTCGEPTFTPTPTGTTAPTGTSTFTPTITPTHGPSNSVVISEFRTRGSEGGSDEFIELYNKTGSPIDISGWRINGSSSCGPDSGTRVTITNGVTIPAYRHFLLTNSQGYTGTVTGDATYSVGISDDGGIGLFDDNNLVIDAVGMCITTTFHEGTPLAPTTDNQDQSYERFLGGNAGNAVDTNNNANDFFLNASSSNPQNLSSPPVPPCTPGTAPNSILDFSFNPATMTINQGTTVIWTNNGNVQHTSTSDPSSTEQWDSGGLNSLDTFSHTFNSPGTFTYHCDLHPTMTATINVTAGCGPVSTPTSTPSPTPAGVINGHLTWQSISAVNRPNVTGTLTLCVSGAPQAFSFNTDTNGNFTVTTGLPNGTYHWQVKGGRHISNSSTADGAHLVIASGHATQEFATQKGGNTTADNIVNATDFNNLKAQFGQSGVKSGDADYNLVVNASDFNIQKSNFGQAGHALVCP